jgi:phage terminase large subunit GpA-like protein
VTAAVAGYRRVIAIMGAQMGKTAGILNEIGRQLDDTPAPILYVGPTRDHVSTVIEPEITAMLKSVPRLWAGTDKSHRAQKLAKVVNGVPLRLAWAGSPTQLASQPARTVMVDELDRMKPIPGEGDPLTLAEARTTNYAKGRIIVTSTPTGGNVDVERHPVTGIEHWKPSTEAKDVPSPIWKLWEEGTRHEWAVPCPHCREYFVPRFRNLKIPDKATPRVALREARLMCPNCGALIENSAKVDMNAAGHYLAPGQRVVDGQVVGSPPDSETASFWASGLMSPWKTFGQRASDWVSAIKSGDQERIRGIINLGFGELYAFKGDALPAEAVRANVGAYKLGDIPEGVRSITCGVDVQKLRLVYSVRGWGYSMESWLIEAGEIWGETDNRSVWAQLGELLERKFGDKMIRRMGIDSGYRPGDKIRKPDNLIYEFCMAHRSRAVPTKGHDRLSKPLQPSNIDVNFRGQTVKQGLTLWHIDSDYFKSWLAARLTWPVDQPGRFWVPLDVTDDYCSQITAESRVAKPSGAAVWVKVRNENHYLDCEAINTAMAQSLGIHRRVRPSKEAPAPVAETPQMPPAAIAPPRPVAKKQFQPGPPRRSKNWVTGW